MTLAKGYDFIQHLKDEVLLAGSFQMSNGHVLRWAICKNLIFYERWESGADEAYPLAFHSFETSATTRLILHELLTVAGLEDGKQLDAILGWYLPSDRKP
jgi:hypothetical protein